MDLCRPVAGTFGEERMFNVSEVTTLKARHRQAGTIATMMAALLVGGALSPAQAQQRGQATPTTPRLVVVTFRGPDRAAAVAAADAIRDRLMREYSMRQLWVIDKKNLATQLGASGYPVDEPLTQNDAQALAKVMRADEYVDGTVTPVNGQFKVDARLVLTRNNALVQPLPSQTVAKPADDEAVHASGDAVRAVLTSPPAWPGPATSAQIRRTPPATSAAARCCAASALSRSWPAARGARCASCAPTARSRRAGSASRAPTSSASGPRAPTAAACP
jgi:hypothetical protein